MPGPGPAYTTAMAVQRVPAERVACKRRDVLERVKEKLDELENPPYQFPIPKARLMGEKCECAMPKNYCQPPPGEKCFKPRPAQYW